MPRITVAILLSAVLVLVAIQRYLSNNYGPSTSALTPQSEAYQQQKKLIKLRPDKKRLLIPSNQLWAIHTNPVSQGWNDDQRIVGKPWDRVEVRFVLLPEIRERSKETSGYFERGWWDKLLIMTIAQPVGADGDTRKEWRLKRQEGLREKPPPDTYPVRMIASHPDLGLDEYEGKDEFGTRFFRANNTIIRCWYKPMNWIKHSCESSFNLSNGLLVNVEYASEFLPRWKELLEFAVSQSESYVD